MSVGKASRLGSLHGLSFLPSSFPPSLLLFLLSFHSLFLPQSVSLRTQRVTALLGPCGHRDTGVFCSGGSRFWGVEEEGNHRGDWKGLVRKAPGGDSLVG